jgi:FkbM family methyltransferase
VDRVVCDGLAFDCRPGTSDAKAVREVVARRGYARRGFAPRDGEQWIDIGANVGAFSVWAAASGAKVIAFEPDTESAELARHNVALNGLSRYVSVLESALTADDKPGTATFYRNTANGNVWRNSLYKQWRGGDSITVETWPVAEYWQPAFHVKLDAEGAEMPILERYAEQRVKRLVFEWSFDIDPSLDRFNRVITKLRRTYGQVRFSKIAGGHREWQASWFPPCRTVWCDA